MHDLFVIYLVDVHTFGGICVALTLPCHIDIGIIILILSHMISQDTCARVCIRMQYSTVQPATPRMLQHLKSVQPWPR